MLIPVYDTADEYLDGEPSSEKETELGEDAAEGPQRDCSGSVCPINPWNRLSKKTNTFFSEKQKNSAK